jgi:hypothetical protein
MADASRNPLSKGIGDFGGLLEVSGAVTVKGGACRPGTVQKSSAANRSLGRLVQSGGFPTAPKAGAGFSALPHHDLAAGKGRIACAARP